MSFNTVALSQRDVPRMGRYADTRQNEFRISSFETRALEQVCVHAHTAGDGAKNILLIVDLNKSSHFSACIFSHYQCHHHHIHAQTQTQTPKRFDFWIHLN